MKKQYRWILFLLLVPVILIIAFDLYTYYPEKHLVGSYDFELFKVVGNDTINECFTFSENVTPADTSEVLLCGIRLKLDYVSQRHENLWEQANFPPGWFGSADSLVDLGLRSGNNDISDELQDASTYRYFLLQNSSVANHSAHPGINGICYVAETHSSLSEFIVSYNSTVPGSTIPEMTNWHFFLIPKKLNKEVIRNGIQVIVITDRGKIAGANLKSSPKR